jgi:hypothetical protein
MRYWQHVGLLVAVAGVWAADSLAMTNDGNDVLQKCTAALQGYDTMQGDWGTIRDIAWCMAYLTGFVEGHQAATVAPGVICLPDGVRSPAQLARILVAWLRTHPVRLHEDRGFLTGRCCTSVDPVLEGSPRDRSMEEECSHRFCLLHIPHRGGNQHL